MRTDTAPSSPHSILLIRLSSLGDIILSSALPRILRQRNPDAQIHVLCAAAAREVFEHSPYVDRVIDYHRDCDTDTLRHDLAAALPTRKFSLVLDLQNNRRSKRLRRDIGEVISSIDKYRMQKLALLWLKSRSNVTLPAIPLRYLATAVGIDPLDAAQATNQKTSPVATDHMSGLRHLDDGGGLEIWLPGESAAEGYPPESRAERSKASNIGLAPGARHKTKRWPAARFAALANQLLNAGDAEQIVLLGGPQDAEVNAQFREHLERPDALLDLGEAQTLTESLRAIDGCKLVVSNDSAVGHLAAARRVPVVSIFGSTTPDFGFAPYGTPLQIVEQKLDCRPCTHIGRAECPRGHFRCMLDITVGQVLQAARRLYAS